MVKVKARVRAFCFTVNNYKEEPEFDGDYRYLIFGREKAPGTGTPHLQGYVYFKSPKSLRAAAAYFPGGHLEIAKGGPNSNIEYCSKDGDFQSYGTAPVESQDKGTMEKDRWTRIVSLARLHDFETILRDYPDVYATRLPTLENLYRKRPIALADIDGDLPHEWYVGPTGSGKSRYARDQYPGAYIKDPQTVWWDDYDHQDVVIIDDFDKYQKAQGGDMKRWLDRYIFPAQIKGGYLKIRPQKIIVTSQYLPSEIWDDDKTVDAINRRVTIRDFTSLDPYRVRTPPRRLPLQELREVYGARHTLGAAPQAIRVPDVNH